MARRHPEAAGTLLLCDGRWGPDGSVRGSYGVYTIPEGSGAPDLSISEECDIDGDSIEAHFTAMKTINAAMAGGNNRYQFSAQLLLHCSGLYHMVLHGSQSSNPGRASLRGTARRRLKNGAQNSYQHLGVELVAEDLERSELVSPPGWLVDDRQDHVETLRRQAVGLMPTCRLKAREKAASEP